MNRTRVKCQSNFIVNPRTDAVCGLISPTSAVSSRVGRGYIVVTIPSRQPRRTRSYKILSGVLVSSSSPTFSPPSPSPSSPSSSFPFLFSFSFVISHVQRIFAPVEERTNSSKMVARDLARTFEKTRNPSLFEGTTIVHPRLRKWVIIGSCLWRLRYGNCLCIKQIPDRYSAVG